MLNQLKEGRAIEAARLTLQVNHGLLDAIYLSCLETLNANWIPQILATPSHANMIAIDTTVTAKGYVVSRLHHNPVNALLIVGDTTTIKTQVNRHFCKSLMLF